jgi:predicted transcriptional regulator
MKKKTLFYTVEKELQDIDGIEETTGNKKILVYDIVDNKPNQLLEIDSFNEDNSIDSIYHILDAHMSEDVDEEDKIDLGVSVDEIEFIQL